MKGLRSDKAGVLLFKGLIVFVIWGVIVFGVWRYLGDEWAPGGDVTAFDPELNLYLAKFPFLDPPLEHGAHIRGKAVVVDVTDGVVLETTFDLPEGLGARQPAEVGTVIQIERLLEKVGEYGDGSPAYRQNAVVRLVDLGCERAIGEARQSAES